MSGNVLITGATGGLGLALVDAFCSKGYRVTATGRSTLHAGRFRSMGVAFKPADLIDPAAIAPLCIEQDTVVHAAALSSSWGSRDDFRQINVDATENLVNQSQLAGVRSFVFISSPSITTAMKDQIGQKEGATSGQTPLNDYAQTKLEAEKYVLAADSENFRTIALRPRALIGPDDKVLLPQILKLVQKGKLPLLRGGKACIDLTDVRDAAAATCLALEKIASAHGRYFHISGGTPVNMKQLTHDIARICKQELKFFNCPMLLAKAMAWSMEKAALMTGQKEEPPLTLYKLATMAYSQTFDLTQASTHLGYLPRHDARATLLDILRKQRHETL